jgi:hypothetical protein
VNYATWKLNFTNPEYGTGPEDKIAELGFGAESGWVSGEVQNGGTILGYVTEPQNESELAAWEFENITEQQALNFCLNINPKAYLLSDGKIGAPYEAIEI